MTSWKSAQDNALSPALRVENSYSRRHESSAQLLAFTVATIALNVVIKQAIDPNERNNPTQYCAQSM